MMVLSNLAAQTLQPGQAVTFDRILIKAGCGECFNRQLPASVKLRGRGTWDLSFSGNVTSPTSGVNTQLAMTVGGSPLVETAMNRTITTANNLENISTETMYQVCCEDLNRISVVNTGTVPVVLAANSAFVVRRICG